jgi:predicted metal-dependent peptidase
MATLGYKKNIYPSLEESLKIVSNIFGKNTLVKEYINEWFNGDPNTNDDPSEGEIRPYPKDRSQITRPEQYGTIELDNGEILNMGRVINNIGAARRAVAHLDPTYAKWLDELIPIITFERIPTMATDGQRLFINPYFASHLKLDEMIFIFLHEIFHNILDHHSRKKRRNHELFNIAADYEVNAMIKDLFPSKKNDKGQELHFEDSIDKDISLLFDKKYDGLDAETIYDMLLKKWAEQLKNKPNDLKDPDKKKGNKNPIDDDWELPEHPDPRCQGCSNCDDCPDCPDCQGGGGGPLPPECQGCSDCDDCPDCPPCKNVPPECKTCKRCKDCPNCPTCKGTKGPAKPNGPSGPTPPGPIPKQEQENKPGQDEDKEDKEGEDKEDKGKEKDGLTDNPGSSNSGSGHGGEGARGSINIEDLIESGKIGQTITEEEGNLVAKDTGYTEEEIEKQTSRNVKDIKDKLQKEVVDHLNKKRGGNNSGKVPGSKLLSAVTKLQAGDVNWKAEFKRYVGKYLSKVKIRKSYGNKKKASMNTYTGAANRYDGFKRRKIKDPEFGSVVCLIDVSGSMSSRDLKKIVIEINNIIFTKGIKKLTTVFFDSIVPNTPGAVQTLNVKSKKGLWVPKDIPGGGGTDFNAPIQWTEEHIGNPELVIMFTDGYAPDPKTPSFYDKFIWVLYNNDNYDAPFGRQVVIRSKN